MVNESAAKTGISALTFKAKGIEALKSLKDEFLEVETELRTLCTLLRSEEGTEADSGDELSLTNIKFSSFLEPDEIPVFGGLVNLVHAYSPQVHALDVTSGMRIEGRDAQLLRDMLGNLTHRKLKDIREKISDVKASYLEYHARGYRAVSVESRPMGKKEISEQKSAIREALLKILSIGLPDEFRRDISWKLDGDFQSSRRYVTEHENELRDNGFFTQEDLNEIYVALALKAEIGKTINDPVIVAAALRRLEQVHKNVLGSARGLRGQAHMKAFLGLQELLGRAESLVVELKDYSPDSAEFFVKNLQQIKEEIDRDDGTVLSRASSLERTLNVFFERVMAKLVSEKLLHAEALGHEERRATERNELRVEVQKLKQELPQLEARLRSNIQALSPNGNGRIVAIDVEGGKTYSDELYKRAMDHYLRLRDRKFDLIDIAKNAEPATAYELTEWRMDRSALSNAIKFEAKRQEVDMLAEYLEGAVMDSFVAGGADLTSEFGNTYQKFFPVNIGEDVPDGSDKAIVLGECEREFKSILNALERAKTQGPTEPEVVVPVPEKRLEPQPDRRSTAAQTLKLLTALLVGLIGMPNKTAEIKDTGSLRQTQPSEPVRMPAQKQTAPSTAVPEVPIINERGHAAAAVEADRKATLELFRPMTEKEVLLHGHFKKLLSHYAESEKAELEVGIELLSKQLERMARKNHSLVIDFEHASKVQPRSKDEVVRNDHTRNRLTLDRMFTASQEAVIGRAINALKVSEGVRGKLKALVAKVADEARVLK